MIIGIDIRTLMDTRYSGVSEYTLNLVNALLKLDSKNEYRLFYNAAKDISASLRQFDCPNVKIIKKSIPNKILNYLFFKFFNSPKIDKLLKADVFFMPHINFIGLSGKTKSILTIHDLSFLRYPEFFSARKNFWHKMINVKKLVSRFDEIVAVSENTKRDIVDLCGVEPEKIKVIYSGAEDIYRQMMPNDAKERQEQFKIKIKYNLPEKFILFLGTVEPRKNIDGLVRAYEILREKNGDLAQYKLLIAGGRGWKSKKIYKRRENSKYRDDIKFLGYIEKKDKVYLYNLASLFVYPSFYEGFGFPPLEAMACGTPIITGLSSSLPEIIGNAGLMVDPYNISDLAAAMEKVLIDDDLRNNLIQKGLERVKNFSWEKAAKNYLELFTR